MKSSVLIALTHASVDAAYGANQLCCEKRLGISRKLTDYGLPLGLVTYMPAGTVATTLFSLYAAQCYGVSASLIWYAAAVLLTVSLIVATPPMPGIGLLAYAAIFSRMGIPDNALTFAMAADIIFGFAVSALNQAMLQLELILEADRLELLDREVLKR
jgi:Na+/H+-dicarboxylate symporter